MIKANEVRIGNWVKDFDGTIVQIDKSYMSYLLDYPKNETEPIETTFDILIKAGFERFPFDANDDELDYLKLELPERQGQISFVVGDDIYYVSNTHSPDFYGAEANIKYVHQLQNLFFALTGGELEINL